MTVSSTLNKIIYNGNGAQTSFPFSFSTPINAPTDIQVFFTDTLGNITLLAANQYTIVFNPPISPNPTPSGGTVTYNPLGVPIGLGTKLTIYRNLPLSQLTSLPNQTTLYQTSIEQALDYLTMALQQVQELQGRGLAVAVSDPTPGLLPSVTARALQVLGFDSSGNPIAVSTAPAGVISGAMAPVVGAATLAAGRTALGLGGMAVEGIGQGLLDDGFGNVRLSMLPIGDSIPITVVGATAFTRRILFANVTYTLPQTTTLYNGFGFWIDTSAFNATFAINGADAFNGATTGASLIEGPGQSLYLYTNGAGTWFIDKGVLPGNNSANNLQLNATVAGSALTIAIKDRNGNDPSSASPVIFNYCSGNGQIVSRAVAAPLTITVPNGASLGTVNGQASRIWVGLFDNAGSPVLGVYNALSATTPSILCWDESSQPNTTAVSAGSTLSQVWYTSGGLTSKPFKVLGFVESTQPTAGAWTVAPSKIQLFGPGVKKPGDVVQEVATAIGASDTINSGTFIALTNNRITFTPQSPANLVRVEAGGGLVAPNATGTGQTTQAALQLSNGTVNNTGLFGSLVQNSLALAGAGASQANQVNPAYIFGFNLPNTNSAVTYAVQGRASGGGGSGQYGGTTMMSLKEISV